MMLNWSPEQVNEIFPICGIIAYSGGIVIRRSCLLNLARVRHQHNRGAIELLSKRSLNRLAILVRSSGVRWKSVLTLTYGANYPMDGKLAKRHLNKFLIYARREFGVFDYFWILEFQKRGAVHFHLATTLDEPNVFQLQRFADIWANISQPGKWPYCPLANNPNKLGNVIVLDTWGASWSVHAHPKAWEKVKRVDGMERYLSKYANKLKQKEVPKWYQNVGRFWGVSRGVKLPEGQHYHGSEDEVRQVLAERGRDVQHWEILPKIVLC